MSPFREHSNPHLSSQRPSFEHPDIYRQGGRIELSHYAEKEWPFLFHEFSTHFEKWSKAAQSDLLEQFLTLAVPTPDEAIKLDEALDEDQRTELAASLAFQIQTTKYAALFHRLWDDLPTEVKDRESIPDAWVDRPFAWSHVKKNVPGPLTNAIMQHPERALLIAPFTDLTKNLIPIKPVPEARLPHERPHQQRERLLATPGIDIKKIPKRRLNHLEAWLVEHRADTIEKKSLFELAFPTATATIELLETCLVVTKEHRVHEPEIFQTYIEVIKQSHPELLYPYLKDFVELGILTSTEARDVLLVSKARFDPMFYATKEEVTQIERIKKEFLRRYPDKDVYELDYLEGPAFDLACQYHRFRGQASHRACDHMVSRPEIFTDFLSSADRVKFFSQCLDRQVPVLCKAETLQLTEGETHELFRWCHTEGEIPFFLLDGSELAALLRLGHEAPVLKHLRSETRLGEYPIDTQRAVMGVEGYIDLFSQRNRTKWLQTITQRTPGFWLENLDAFLRLDVAPLKKMIEDLASSDPDKLLHYAAKIFASIERAQRLGTPFPLSSEEFKRVLRGVLRNSVVLLLTAPAWVRDLLSAEEVSKLIQDRLEVAPSMFFLRSLIQTAEAVRPAVLELKEKVRTIFENDPELFADLLNSHSGIWNDTKKFFGGSQSLDLLVAACEYIDFTDTFVNTFALDLSRPPAFHRVVARLQTRSPHQLPSFLMMLADNSSTAENLSEPSNARLVSETRQKLVERCKTETFAVFQPGMLELLGAAVKEQAKQSLEPYLTHHPFALSRPAIRKMLTQEEYAATLRSRPLFYATQRGKYGINLYNIDKIPNDLVDEFAATDTMLPILMNDRLTQDFYTTLVAQVGSHPFSSLVMRDLETIASDQQERYGSQCEPGKVDIPKEVQQLVQRIDVLRSHPSLVAREREIVALPPQDCERFLSVAEACLLYRLVDDLPSEWWVEPLASLEQELKHRFMVFMAQALDMPELERVSGVSVSCEMLKNLMIYHQQSSEKKPGVAASLRTFVEKLFEGNFLAWRAYGVDKLPVSVDTKSGALEKLKAEHLLPPALSLEQYEVWNQDDMLDFEETLEYSGDELHYLVRKILDQAVADGHVACEDLPTDAEALQAQYHALFHPLQGWTEELRTLEAAFQEHRLAQKTTNTLKPFDPVKRSRFDELKKRIREYKMEFEQEMDQTMAQLYLTRLRSMGISELEQQRLSIGKRQIPFDQVFKKCEIFFERSSPAFLTDLRRIQQELIEARRQLFQTEGRVSKSKLALRDTVDPEVYFRIGAEPVESCQHFDGGSYNEGLLAYVMDPNVRILQIWNELGKLITRGVLRLLEDDHGQPALFLERIYSLNNNPKIDEAITKLALKKAQAMNIKLFSRELAGVGQGEDLRNANLTSRGSRHAYVYTDAGGLTQRQGKYTITHALAIAV